MTMEFVTFKWKAPTRYRSTFGPEHVNTMLSGIGRQYRKPFRLTCITDDSRGISSEVRIIPLWDDWAHLPSPHGTGYPSCYRRIKLFSADAVNLIGPYFACLDLDMIFTGDITPLFEPDADFKIWGDTNRNTPYNGSMWKLLAGARRRVWDDFDPIEAPARSRRLGYIGSDQGWISACLGPNEARWTQRDGVYSFRMHVARYGYRLPANARIVIFHGAVDPWSPLAQKLQWVRHHYR
jgi:hypothetical protein